MFEIKKHLIKVDNNRFYLPVSSRLVWFRQDHPDWGIETKPITIDLENKVAIFEATVYDSSGKLMAKGTKMETATGFPSYIEAAETGAIGRALAVCGYGTQFAPDLDELSSGKLVDSALPHTGGAPYVPGNGHQNGGQHSSGNGSQNAGHDSDQKHACSVCEKALTKGQEALSLRNYGIALCPNCQKDRKAGASVEAAAG